MQAFLDKHYKKIVAVIMAFMAVVSVLNAKNDSAIFDETAHIPAGYSYVRFHDMRLNPEHPPLLKDLSGLFILPINPKMHISKDYWAKDINGQWDAGRDLLWQEGNNADNIIFWGRIPFVILSLILGLFIFKWVRELAGTAAGLFALTLYAFDPNILGHNHFVTTDLGIAAFGAFTFYYFLRFIKNPSWHNVRIGGIFLGLLQLAKFSSIIYFPILGLVLIVYPLVKTAPMGMEDNWKQKLKNLGEYLGKGIVAFAISIILVWTVYLVNIYEMPKDKLAQTVEYYFPHDDSSPKIVMSNKVLLALDKSNVTKPLSEYVLGVAMVFKRVEGGNGAYFMQQVSGKAFPAYFPTVFVLKEPLASLALFLLALIIALTSTARTWIGNIRLSFIARYLRDNIVGLSLFGFIVLYSYVSITGNLNIGFRHLFPILPFIYILTAISIFGLIGKLEEYRRLIWGIIITLLAVFLISDTVAAYPAYMSYFNQIAGGPKNGYLYVTDSNADWGQDLKRLNTFIDDYNECKIAIPISQCENHNYSKNPIDTIRVNYFGGGDVRYYLGDKYIDWWDSKRPIEPGWYAISTNYLMGSIYDKEKKDSESYRWIRDNKIQPVYQVGTSILIYYITPEVVKNIR